MILKKSFRYVVISLCVIGCLTGCSNDKNIEEAERKERLENRKKARQEMAEYQAEVEAAAQASKGKKKKDQAAEEIKAPDEETVKRGMTAKEINRMKLAAARKRDAEKYGEEYVEVTDDDLR